MMYYLRKIIWLCLCQNSFWNPQIFVKLFSKTGGSWQQGVGNWGLWKYRDQGTLAQNLLTIWVKTKLIHTKDFEASLAISFKVINKKMGVQNKAHESIIIRLNFACTYAMKDLVLEQQPCHHKACNICQSHDEYPAWYYINHQELGYSVIQLWKSTFYHIHCNILWTNHKK